MPMTMTVPDTSAVSLNVFGRLRDQFRWLVGNGVENTDAERGQAVMRVVTVPPIDAYVLTTLLVTGAYVNWIVAAMVIYTLLYIPGSWALLWHIDKHPGYNFKRRVFTIFNDYLAMTFAMAVGGAITVPVFAMVLWVTVGNGLRYGSHYLIAATFCALASISVAALFNEYMQANPFVVLTLLLTIILVPAYIYGLQKRLQTAYAQALEANLAKSRFLAQASHDLRQPIHAISLYTAWLSDAGLKREARKMVENIDRSLHSVSSLFRSLLDISTLDSGSVTPERRPVAVGDVINEVVRQNAHVAAWSKVTLRVVPSACYVDTDETLLTTMVQNIVNNAIKYAPGRPVLVGCRRHGDRLSIDVYDRGDGIAEEHLPRLFEEFYRVRERGDRDVEGVGLGLPIVQRLGRLMGLTVDIRSRKYKGTGVSITGLPIVAQPAQQSAQVDPVAPARLHGLRVLLVEDDKEVLLATAALLEKWGCIPQAELEPPTKPGEWDVLVTDYDLGNRQTGSDCIARVRTLKKRTIPAIIMTGHDEARVRADVDDIDIPILSKPVRPAELRSTLTTLLLTGSSD
jgi:signal transduction histidine kinase